MDTRNIIDFMKKDGTMVMTDNLLRLISLPKDMDDVIRTDDLVGKDVSYILAKRGGTCGIAMYLPAVLNVISTIFNNGGYLIIDPTTGLLHGGSKNDGGDGIVVEPFCEFIWYNKDLLAIELLDEIVLLNVWLNYRVSESVFIDDESYVRVSYFYNDNKMSGVIWRTINKKFERYIPPTPEGMGTKLDFKPSIV